MNQLPLLGLGAALLVGLAGCSSQAAHARDHWTGYSVGPSLSRNFLSYDVENDGNYTDFQWRKKKDMEITMRRHFFNSNPDNPFEPVDKDVYAPRPVHSVMPAPQRYIHVEGLVFGAVSLGAGGLFIPFPVDSFLGTMEEGGSDEFAAGIGQTTRPIGQVTASFLHDSLGFPETQGDGWRGDGDYSVATVRAKAGESRDAAYAYPDEHGDY
jgi:hypothetical protein